MTAMGQDAGNIGGRTETVQGKGEFLSTLFWAFLFLGVAGSLQLYTSYPWDTDTAFHAVVGRLIRQYGLLHSFPWTPFSWISDKYADKELFFHLLFVPLAKVDFVYAARIVGTVTGASALFAIYYLLREERIPYAGLWALLPLACSSAFIFRFALVRPHLVSITLAILLFWGVARSRLLPVAVVAMLYPWAYVAFWQLPLLILISVESSRLLSGRKIRWQPAAVTVAGIIAGLLLHPNGANLLNLNWIQMTDVLIRNAWGVKTGFDLGSEFLSPSLQFWLRRLLPVPFMALFAIVVGWRNRKENSVPLACAIAAVIFMVLTSRTSRFSEYFVPFSVTALALSSPYIRGRYFCHGVLAVSLAYLLLFGSRTLPNLATRMNDMPPQLAALLQSNIPPDAQVFTPHWKYTGPFMLGLPGRKFIVALDPTFFYVKDPDLYTLWYRISHDAPPDTPEIIRRKFNSRYVLSYNLLERKAFLERLHSAPGVRTVVENDFVMLFDLGPLDR